MVLGNHENNTKVNISIEEKSGFCFGVTRVIKMAEEILDRDEKLYCLGEIVHNGREVQRLIDKGILFIDAIEYRKLKNAKVLIRAHGEPPETYEIARKNNLKLIDGTCPIVESLQKKIRLSYYKEDEDSLIIVYGKKDHPEVIGLTGQTHNRARVIRSAREIGDIPWNAHVYLYSQTTMDTAGFLSVANYLEDLKRKGEIYKLTVKNTICGHISHRQPGIIEFARNNDVVVFVAGKHSSNGKVLYDICKKENDRCYFVSDEHQVDAVWFENSKNIGVCGATSTPRWLLELIAERIKEFTKS